MAAGRRPELGAEEEVIIDTRPHPKMLFGPAFLAVAGVVAAVAVRDVGAPDRYPMLLCLALSVLGLLWLGTRWAVWTTTRLVLTTDRLMTNRGVLGKKNWQVGLERIHDISCAQTLSERLLAVGDLAVDTGGDRGHVIHDVPRPYRVQNEIYEAMDSSTLTSATRAMERRDLTIPEQIQKLDELRQRGVITDSEFDIKKTQLLDRM